MKLIVDMDETIVDLLSNWLYHYNKDWGDTLTRQDITSYEIERFVKPECGDKIFDYLHRPWIYFYALPHFEGISAVKRLSEVHDIWFVTKGPWSHDIFKQKMLWLEYWLPGLGQGRMVYIADKSILHGDVIIDDYYGNLRGFDGRKILVDRPHNHSVRSGKYERMTWDQIYDDLIGK